ASSGRGRDAGEGAGAVVAAVTRITVPARRPDAVRDIPPPTPSRRGHPTRWPLPGRLDGRGGHRTGAVPEVRRLGAPGLPGAAARYRRPRHVARGRGGHGLGLPRPAVRGADPVRRAGPRAELV